MGKKDGEMKALSFWCYICPSPYLLKPLYLDHLLGFRCFVHTSYLILCCLVSLFVMLTKSDRDKFLSKDFSSLSKLVEILENCHPKDIVFVFLFSWFLISCYCDHMFLFPSGKISRMLIWLLVPTAAYLVCGIYILPLLLLYLQSTYQNLLKPSPKPHIRRRLKMDTKHIFRGNVHNLSDWDKIFQNIDL